MNTDNLRNRTTSTFLRTRLRAPFQLWSPTDRAAEHNGGMRAGEIRRNDDGVFSGVALMRR